MNKVLLTGNLTRDPELSQTPSGIAVCKFGLAVNRAYTNANGERDVDFFNITVWRGLAENCAKYLCKGKKISLIGNIQNRSYTDKKGVSHTATEIVGEDIEFLGGKSNDDTQSTASSKPTQTQMDMFDNKKKTLDELKPVDNDDLPF